MQCLTFGFYMKGKGTILTALVSAKSEEWSTLKCSLCSKNNVFVWWQVCHGDIKTENVMVTGWNWVLLTDIACKLQACYSFFRRITLQTSTSSFTHLDVAAVILHQKGFWIPDRLIRCSQKEFNCCWSTVKSIASQIWILWGINKEIWLQRWIY